jgi:hypothetical protein
MSHAGPARSVATTSHGNTIQRLEMLDGNPLSPLCVARMREEHHAVVG